MKMKKLKDEINNIWEKKRKIKKNRNKKRYKYHNGNY